MTTLSIAGRCAGTGMLGLAIVSSSPAVAARSAFARAGAGVVASLSLADPALGQRGLALLSRGLGAERTLAVLLEGNPFAAWRQIAILDGQGRSASFTGRRAFGRRAVAEGRDCVAAGSIVAGASVPAAMTAAFERAPGHLGDRLMCALQAGRETDDEARTGPGEETGPLRSAGLLIVERASWPVADLRVDWDTADPVGALAALWRLYAPEMPRDLTRELDPDRAPREGALGDP